MAGSPERLVEIGDTLCYIQRLCITENCRDTYLHFTLNPKVTTKLLTYQYET